MHAVTTEFAPAKINLALHVLGRRLDGYHELDSVVAFADVGDVLTFTPSTDMTFTVDGRFAADVPASADNLVLKAHAALQRHCSLPPVAIKLTKNLPVASGIGGGSTDAAATLRGLLKLSRIQFDTETISEIAVSLGADVPVCLHAKACRMQGVGEIITPLERLPAAAILLVNPLLPCGTRDVFRTMGLKAGDTGGLPLQLAEPLRWRNDMEVAAIKVLPVIDEVLTLLRRLPNSLAVRMSGSGATCFALFDTYKDAQSAKHVVATQRASWWTAATRLF